MGPAGSSLQEDIYAASGMWGWTINNAWELTNSARVDRLQLSRSGPIDPSSSLTDADFTREITKVSYNSGLVWKATADDSFRLSAARGLRMASLFDFGINLRPGAQIAGFPVLQIGNPDKNPTIVTDYELGWDHKVKPIDGVFKADVFVERTADVLMPGGSVVACPFGFCAGPISNNFVIQGNNIGSSNTVGAEFDIKGKIDENWSWGFNDTVQKIHDHYTVTTFNTQDQTPANIANAHVGYQDGPWETDAFVYYTSLFREPEPGALIAVPSPLVAIPSHVSLSGRIGYKINDKTTVALSGQELEKTRAMTSTALETERRLFLSLDRAF
jgi:iron complex outermembrane receptor protein